MSSVGRITDRFGSYNGTTILSDTFQGPSRTGFEKCEDWLSSPFQSNPLTHRRCSFGMIYASGQYASGFHYYTSSGVPLQSGICQVMSDPFHYGTFPAKLSMAYLAQLAQANANPNSPIVDLPLAFYELRELPGLLKWLGDLEIRGLKALGRGRTKIRPGDLNPTGIGGEANLAYQFGIKPLISDALSLLGFVDAVTAREEYLRGLSKPKGKRIKRTLLIENFTLPQSPIIAFPGGIENGGNFKIVNRYDVRRRYWYSARAQLNATIPARDLESLAMRSVLGLQDVSFETIWNAIPWSWLIDWFSSTGTMLAAFRGGIPWTFSDLNLMAQTDYTLTGTFTGKPPLIKLSGDVLKGKGVEHYRLPTTAFAIPVLKLNFLDMRQLGILSSLLCISADGPKFHKR